MIKVSIIVPFYNPGDGIRKTIESIQNQSLKEIEIILVDDGSTDVSSDVVESYTKDKRVRLVRKENGGVSSARNRGISEARGEYIGFVDADDWIEKDMYKDIYNLAVENSSDVCIGGFVREIDGITENGDIDLRSISKETPEFIKRHIIFNMISGEDPLKWDGIIMGSVWRMIYKRKTILEKSILFDQELAIMEDTVFCLEAIIEGENIAVGEKRHYHYVYSSDSAVNRYREDFYSQVKAVNRRIKDIVEGSQFYDEELSKRLSWRYIKLCIWGIMNEVRDGNRKSFFEKTNSISKICSDQNFVSAIENLEKSKYNARNRIKLFLIKRNMKTSLYIYFKLADKNRGGKPIRGENSNGQIR